MEQNKNIVCISTICYAQEVEPVFIYGADIKNGNYSVEVKSSSSMFRIVEAELQVVDGNMTVVMTLSGTGYAKLFMGTGKEAALAEEERYIPYIENKEGAYTYTIPVEALNKEFDCAAYSKKKEQWYDRQLMILSDSLPKEALLAEMEKRMILTPVKIQKEDGNYTIEVTLRGGSGKAAIVSPAQITITEENAIVSLEWSSPNFDYMIVNEEQYFPVQTEGNAIFEIPILVLDQEMEVIVDTVAMSKPHEITYTLTFHADTIQKAQNNKIQSKYGIIIGCFIVILFIIGIIFTFKIKQKKRV